ncbi:uncharacterized protein (DUF2141 family) [Dysgonomonas hofstadii]|uniref:Uncharacterized protein (DUF2141 family) n=1 Tax=Dysgonomonas hofstadii TaxID=637886 RepID=A0A840CLZ1_9BACT|nr:Ig-like domain-containing domain [Dysgonomonas hofstadii]MBB4036396.1 uncharacterized protein (DUF2141 family) [Dysgonomonas hofstadii]
MLQFFRKNVLFTLVFATIAMVITACANMASPTGGSYDLDPPKVVKVTPAFNATNVTKGKIVFEFDENVTVEKPNENVIITPPQRAFPVIQAVNKKVTVELRDTLIPNTTYTIDFTNSIVDNNEKNPLENFSFSFSTGDVVDSLIISGKVLTADNLEPVKGIYVGLHSNLDDTAFTKVQFDRIARTSESGDFAIKGVAVGKYRLFALDDANRDYKYDNPSEAIAFFEEILEPTSMRATRYDTLYTDTTKKIIDTIKQIEYTRFLPDNIVMRSFKSDFQRQYLQKYERTENKLSIFFGAPTKMPELEPLNFDPGNDWAVLEKSAKNDTLIYWLKDKMLEQTDTLAFRMTYLKTDTLNQSVPVTDTLRFVDRGKKQREKLREKEEEKEKKRREKEGDEEPQVTFLGVNHNLTSAWDTYKNIMFEFAEPILDDSLSLKIIFQQLKDSVYRDVPLQLQKDSLNPRRYTIRHRWQYNEEYLVKIDSAAVYGIYGLWNNKIEQKFKVKAEDQYAQLAIRVTGVDSIPSFIELLDKSDKPIRKSRVRDNAAVFRDLNPGTYYARIILDTNNNGIWDTGDYEKNIQPEMVCYSPKVYELKAYFMVDDLEPWAIDTTTLAKQKPLEITKQKPQEKEARRKQLEELERKQGEQNRGRNSNASTTTGSNQDNNTYSNSQTNMQQY